MSEQELSQTLGDQQTCDREAFHLFATIQSHGVFLAFTWPDQRIQVVSENAGHLFSTETKQVLGARLEHYLPSNFIDVLGGNIESFPWESKGRHIDLQPEIKGKPYDAYLFESEGLFVLEFEEYQAQLGAQESDIKGEQTIKDFMLRSKKAQSLEELSHWTCAAIRKITGLDRVMMYRFMPPHWHGQVIGEDRVISSHSYMGHRFPASDIPRPARDLYLRNQVRLIPNVRGEVVPLTSSVNPLTKKPLDLSDSRLRSVAKVHIEYLKNMNVGASFSVAVTDHGELWGLIACHHMSEIHISQSRRTACEIIAHAFSIQAPLLETLSYQNERLDFEFRLKKILESLRLSPDPLDQFFKQHRTVTETFGATGIALVGDSLKDFAGLTPLRADIEKLARWLHEEMQREHRSILAIDDLPAQDPQWDSLTESAAGVLAIAIPEMKDSMLLLFRPELVRTVAWGGDPRKQLERRNFQGSLNPRTSFETWEEILKGKSSPWRRFEIDGIQFLRDIVFDGLIKKEMLIRELSQSRR